MNEASIIPLQDLLKHDVSRKEFLKIVGFSMISALGLSSIIKFLTGKGRFSKPPKSSGYGETPYGQ